MQQLIIKSETVPYLVSTFLSELGRKEIRISEHEMPGLMAIRNKFSDEKPLEGQDYRFLSHDHIQTAVLTETLVDLGANVSGPVAIFSTQ